MPLQTFHVMIWREEDLYVAFCVEAAVVSQGSTPEEALANVREATDLCLKEFRVVPRQGPVFLTTFEANCPYNNWPDELASFTKE